MRTRHKIHSAIKHGGYSATAVLPGESRGAFEKLHRDLIAEFAPNGALEQDKVETIARLLWRKQNIGIFFIAERARDQYSIINGEKPRQGCRTRVVTVRIVDRNNNLLEPDGIDPGTAAAELEAAEAAEAAEAKARRELGKTSYELAKIGKVATHDELVRELAILERLDAMIDRCFKQLLLLKGLKSISTMPGSAPPQGVPGPSRAA